MIPKVIHYCWFGGNPLSDLAKKCIESWKKYCPDYEIVEWNENNFDVESCDYVREAYQAKKWAFVSDYARFKILYDEGGVYFDTDVELIKSIDTLLEKGGFMASESICCDVASGLGIAAPKGLLLYKEILCDYEQSNFITENGNVDLTTVVEKVTKILEKHGLKHKDIIQEVADIIIYPKEYFCPKDYVTGEINITENTVSIHHFNASWLSEKDRINKKLGQKQLFYKNKYGEGYKKHYVMWYCLNIVSIYIKEYGLKKGIENLFEKIINKVLKRG